MKKVILLISTMLILMTGCATVNTPQEPETEVNSHKISKVGLILLCGKPVFGFIEFEGDKKMVILNPDPTNDEHLANIQAIVNITPDANLGWAELESKMEKIIGINCSSTKL